MKVCVTGGLGYIGSHTVVELVSAGHEVCIIDSLATSKLDVHTRLLRLCPEADIGLHIMDVRDTDALTSVLQLEAPDCVIHFAGLKSVAESKLDPVLYYDVNVGGTLSLLKAMNAADVKAMIFSSSATVYGDGTPPFKEESPTGSGILNAYGRSKHAVELVMRDAAEADDSLRLVALRYFNPVGAHPSGLMGEDPAKPPENLMPRMVKAAAAGKPFYIFGTDWPTRDGTCVRDFVHVVDLALGHVAALAAVGAKAPTFSVFNLGSECGTTVREMCDLLVVHHAPELEVVESERRAGDAASSIADATRARETLGWSAVWDTAEMVASAWEWETTRGRKGYE